jgi:hypothetical protein
VRAVSQSTPVLILVHYEATGLLGIPRGPHSKASVLTLLDVSQKGQPTHNEPRCIQATAGLWPRLGEAICDVGRFDV